MKPRYRKPPIRPGDFDGRVKAVKLAYRRIGVPGSGAMARTKRAGPAFVKATRTFQRHHGLHADGVYGRATHEKLVAQQRDGRPAFSAWAATMYRTARIPEPPPPPTPDLSAQAAAIWILGSGKWRADNPGDLRDMRAAAAGKPVWSAAGRWVYIDRRPLDLIVYLIRHGRGHHVGTFAICSDHHYDGMHGHSGGLAVDISSFDGVSIASSHGRAKALELATLIHGAPGDLKPRQLICGGYGNVRDAAISRESIPAADSFYGSGTMQQHTNHAHCGY